MAYKVAGFHFHDDCLDKTDDFSAEEKSQARESGWYDEDNERDAEKREERGEAPNGCYVCGAFLGEDTRAPRSPLAQDLRNMAIHYLDGQVTDLLWRLAAIAEEHDGITANLYHHSATILREYEYPIPATIFREKLPTVVYAAQIAITAIQAWAIKWDSRVILELHEVTEEEEEAHPHLFQTYSHATADHDGWSVYSMRGAYLDMYNDGLSRCECGRQIISFCAYDPMGTKEYGPCCAYVVGA